VAGRGPPTSINYELRPWLILSVCLNLLLAACGPGGAHEHRA